MKKDCTIRVTKEEKLFIESLRITGYKTLSPFASYLVIGLSVYLEKCPPDTHSEIKQRVLNCIQIFDMLEDKLRMVEGHDPILEGYYDKDFS